MRTHRISAAALVVAAVLLLVIGSTAGPAEASRGHKGIAAGIVRVDGAQEPGGGDPDGRGTFAFLAFGDRFCYLLTARGIETPTAAHIHVGERGVDGPVVVALVTPTRGFSGDCIRAQPDSTPDGPDVLRQSDLDAIIADPGGYYVNVHNEPFPAGAIRGQLR